MDSLKGLVKAVQQVSIDTRVDEVKRIQEYLKEKGDFFAAIISPNDEHPLALNLDNKYLVIREIVSYLDRRIKELQESLK